MDASILIEELGEASELFKAIQSNPQQLLGAIKFASELINLGATTFACGNGGSAAEASHLVTELLGYYRHENGLGVKPLPAVTLSADTGVLTCIANDETYDRVFARQIEALGKPGDLLVALSTSGSSVNVANAVESAKGKGVLTLALVGNAYSGGVLATMADRVWIVPSPVVARVQEAHLLFIHLLCSQLQKTRVN